ncbi:Iki1 [Kluyveromyces lactis]|nr:Iki1 [Kluyveromyces lactis]
MASTNNNPKVLLKRTFSLKEQSSLILCTDTMAQSSRFVVEEFLNNIPDEMPVVFVSFETPNRPKYARQFIDASGKTTQQLVAALQPYLPQPQEQAPKMHLVIFDALNYIGSESLTQFISTIASPFVTILTTYHQSIPAWRPAELQNYPTAIQLLQFIANTVIEVTPKTSIDEDDLDADLSRFVIPKNLNNHTYYITLTNKRKSGRAIKNKFLINSKTHDYEYVIEKQEPVTDESPEMFEGLTTFNLNTSEKQKLAKDKVELPYLEAQSFNSGGAIVYEFEKDDDYDEEDPYEDPF